MTDVSFIGLGEMGSAMAGRLLETGHSVRVWNRSPGAADALVESGATHATSIDDALGAGTVISMLANDEAAEAVFTAEALATAPAGTLHINCATLSVATTDRLSDLHALAGVDYVAAPVLGRSNIAAEGRLNIVAAGTARATTRAQPYLDALGKRTWVVGERPSTASLVKIGVNYNLIHALQALAESVTLVERGGVDGITFVEILTDAAFTGSVYTGYGSLIARKAYSPPGFTVGLGLKDLSLAEQAAAANGVVLPTAPVLRDMFERALADPELAPLDWSAIAEITRGLSTDG
ncbi:NAD(P)-dependent oxidoreductase [Cryobacterium sp. TMT2-42-4]|uniref:NAD(P)-dependent oxidoreductase n=1 Tax=Cryobacterium sp. TMT2-42-4 TaxID=1259255 RepID=UPI00106D5CD5|nr:NAD(P)-dependent oxidoreductase [Cryobacterium sp. TMT2-42-4]TFC38001.1 NAD(P)-dependent oxidoreductase [Cryobacterium sp. TMT2-42-4]